MHHKYIYIDREKKSNQQKDNKNPTKSIQQIHISAISLQCQVFTEWEF